MSLFYLSQNINSLECPTTARRGERQLRFDNTQGIFLFFGRMPCLRIKFWILTRKGG